MFKSLCRTCLSFRYDEKLVPLLDKSTTNGLSCYGQAVMAFADVIIQTDDLFPKSICCSCVQLLKNAILFKFRCESSQIKLRALIDKTKSSSDEELQTLIAETLLFERYFPSSEDPSEEQIIGAPKVKHKNCNSKRETLGQFSKHKTIHRKVKHRNGRYVRSSNKIPHNLSDENSTISYDGVKEENDNCTPNEFEAMLLANPKVFRKDEVINSFKTKLLTNNMQTSNDALTRINQGKEKKTCKKSEINNSKKIEPVEKVPNSCDFVKKDADIVLRDLEECMYLDNKLSKEMLANEGDIYNSEEHNSEVEKDHGKYSNAVLDECEVILQMKPEIYGKKSTLKKGKLKAKCDIKRIDKTEPRMRRTSLIKYKRNLTCQICSKVLANRATYKAHMQKHEGCEFICEQCGKGYPVLASLQFHQTTKHGTGPFLQCKHCNFKAPSKICLVEHERLHTGERPFTCEKCGLSFRRQAIWKNHLVLHSEKTVKCTQCPKMFYRKSEMITHCNNVHERKYMYVCPKCGALYAKNSTVRRHLAERHGVPRAEQGKLERVVKDKGLFTAVKQ